MFYLSDFNGKVFVLNRFHLFKFLDCVFFIVDDATQLENFLFQFLDDVFLECDCFFVHLLLDEYLIIFVFQKEIR